MLAGAHHQGAQVGHAALPTPDGLFIQKRRGEIPVNETRISNAELFQDRRTGNLNFHGIFSLKAALFSISLLIHLYPAVIVPGWQIWGGEAYSPIFATAWHNVTFAFVPFLAPSAPWREKEVSRRVAKDAELRRDALALSRPTAGYNIWLVPKLRLGTHFSGEPPGSPPLF
jgi:hypothetical protein